MRWHFALDCGPASSGSRRESDVKLGPLPDSADRNPLVVRASVEENAPSCWRYFSERRRKFDEI
jgi:hypothetical protein